MKEVVPIVPRKLGAVGRGACAGAATGSWALAPLPRGARPALLNVLSL